MKETFTYETESKHMLETYEWDNIWWEHAENNEKDRILIIGDSISCGYRGFVNDLLNGKVFADGIGTSKSIGNDSLISLIDYVFAQQKNYKIIQFNNGLHGWNLSLEEYEMYYNNVIEHIKKLSPESKIVIALTTPVRDNSDLKKYGERNAVVIERNKIAERTAIKYKTEINDLYSEINDNSSVYREDGVHLEDEGYRMLAQKCISVFEKYVTL